MKTAILITTLALSGSAFYLNAQDGPPPPDRPPRHELGGGPDHPGPGPNGPGPGGFRGDGRRMPVPPLFAALDANHDGVIDEQEIAGASTALKSLDKNGDGKITLDEVRPPRPGGPGGPGGDRTAFRGPPPGRSQPDGEPPPPPRPPADE